MAGLDLSKNAGGVPIGVWIVGGTVVVGGTYFFIRNRKNASTAANQLAQNQAAVSAQTAATTPAPSGDFSTDQAEAIYSDIRNLQGQETQFAGTASSLSNQLTTTGTTLGNEISGVGQQVAKIPAGPTGATGSPGPPGPAPAPAPPPRPSAPPPPRPTPTPPSYHVAQVKSDGKHSLQYYASAYGTSMANILAATARSESSDYNSPSSLLHKYVTKGQWGNVVPSGYTLYVPYYR